MTDNTDSVVEQPIQQPMPAEKMFKNDEVERMKQETAHKSYKSGYEQARKEFEKQQAMQNTQQPLPVQDNANYQAPQQTQVPDFHSMIQEELAKRDQELQQRQQEEYGKQILNSIAQKSDLAKQEIPDYDEVTSQIDWQRVPEVLGLSDQFDNAGHLLYHLAKNPQHLGDVMNLVNLGQNRLAMNELRRLSDSLKINRDAQYQERPAEPLSRFNTSAVGVGNGKMGVRDYQKRYTV